MFFVLPCINYKEKSNLQFCHNSRHREVIPWYVWMITIVTFVGSQTLCAHMVNYFTVCIKTYTCIHCGYF